ncbi:capsular biosynthesis protein [Agrobacterium vitis]|uniref:ABC transporter permease n=1 Tax=Agrobacterium vitis TaxID=373 RepID=UPI0009BD327E|nr:ABC transporter permease [Agrobacterium vitis]MCE6075044.1 capsular biosynthesis protein [Agrobacterium vitis]MCF1451706.1 capsular biosynthesis protein [Agrobacterium vitis]MCF1469075.1 capsular biosynthesis protein [Agrobacterium vitis]MCM2453077.1 ABC transporter permease [Agrobacterium vitis]MCM2467550.1 ABC transporter permease [Agrobacterium vitis]
MTDYTPIVRREIATNSMSPVRVAVKQKIDVMHAVIMRDIRSRFFNHGLGFLIVPLFPVTHIVVLLIIYTVLGRDSAFGDDLRLFFATGLMPSLTFTYLSRFMSISLIANKSMMAFPVVRLLDIVLARAFLEFMAIIIALLIMYVFLISFGSNPIPTNPSEALLGFFFTVVLALGFGIIASVISAIAPMFAMVYGLSMVIFYLTSGAPIYLESFPAEVVYACSWNPLFHGVEWIRSAYYLGYPNHFLDKTYLIGFAIGSVACGLLLERILRPYALNT